jgi:hypothetical protein
MSPLVAPRAPIRWTRSAATNFPMWPTPRFGTRESRRRLVQAWLLFQQPSLCALCLDVGRKHAGAVFGFMNTDANAAPALSAVVFGYVAGYFGNYDAPFVPMVALLAIGALLWWQVDPTRELFPQEGQAAERSAIGVHVRPSGPVYSD